MTAVLKYDAACQAIAEAKTVDEVTDWIDKAAAVREYGRRIRNRQIEIDAIEIRVRAKKRRGELVAQMKSDGRLVIGRNKGGVMSDGTDMITLADLGMSRDESSEEQRIAAIPGDSFERLVARCRAYAEQHPEKHSFDVLGEGREVDKKTARENRERVLGVLQRELPDKQFGVILADPEWRFKTYSRDTGMDRAADNHYPTSETDAICARPVGDIAASDCVLFLWATAPMLPDALKVMAAWGFEYKSHIIWKKDRIGTGYWFRNQHELLLVGTKGKIPAPAMGTQFPSVIDAPIGKHSEKPDAFYDLIERYFPTLPKIELNARRSRDGWESWGNEAPEVPQHDPETGEVIEGEGSLVEAMASAMGLDAAANFQETQGPIDERTSIDEFTVLRAVADFCFPDRESLLLRFAGDYIAQRLIVFVSHRSDWTLTEAGRARLRELHAEREPPRAADRPALDDDEQVRFEALKEIQAGRQVHGNLARDLVGVGYLHCTTERLFITEEGLAWLRAIETPAEPEPQQVDLEELIPPARPIDLPLFIAAKEGIA